MRHFVFICIPSVQSKVLYKCYINFYHKKMSFLRKIQTRTIWPQNIMAFIVLVNVYFKLNSMKNFHFNIYCRGTFLSKGGGTHDVPNPRMYFTRQSEVTYKYLLWCINFVFGITTVLHVDVCTTDDC